MRHRETMPESPIVCSNAITFTAHGDLGAVLVMARCGREIGSIIALMALRGN